MIISCLYWNGKNAEFLLYIFHLYERNIFYSHTWHEIEKNLTFSKTTRVLQIVQIFQFALTDQYSLFIERNHLSTKIYSTNSFQIFKTSSLLEIDWSIGKLQVFCFWNILNITKLIVGMGGAYVVAGT